MVSKRMKEHESNACLKHITETVLAEHYVETGHGVLFEYIAKTTSHFPTKRGAGIEIMKHPHDLNRDKGYHANSIWQSIISDPVN